MVPLVDPIHAGPMCVALICVAEKVADQDKVGSALLVGQATTAATEVLRSVGKKLAAMKTWALVSRT